MQQNQPTQSQDTYKLTFSIYDFECTPEEVSAQLGFAPTDAWTKGDPYQATKNMRVPRHNSAWHYELAGNNSHKLEDRLRDLLDILLPHKGAVAKLATKYPTRIFVGAFYTHLNCGFALDQHVIRDLADLNVTLDFDTYFIQETDN